MSKNSITDQTAVNKIVKAAISHDLSNETKVKEAVIHAIKLAASNVGRFEAFNELFNGVSVGTAESIRMYMVNLLKATGIAVTDENGRERKVGFFRYSRTKGWHHPSEKTDAYKAHRKLIDEMSIAKMMEITLGRERAQVERNTEYDLEAFEDRIARAIKFGLDNNLISTAIANQFNGLISAAKRVDPKQIAEDAAKRMEDIRKRAEAAGFTVIDPKDANAPAPAVADNTAPKAA